LIHWVIIGVIQGVAEWLPLSSKTAILLYAMSALGLDFQTAYALAILMQGSTALAGIAYLREDYLEATRAVVLGDSGEGRAKAMFLTLSLVGTGVVGLPILLLIEGGSEGSLFLLLMTALAFLIVAYTDLFQRRLGERTATDVNPLDSAIVGALQGVAMFPGVSRSAVTTLGLLGRRFRAEEALRLSFFTGVIATIGSTLVGLVVALPNATLSAQIQGIAVAWAIGGMVGFFCVGALIRLSARLRVWQLSLVMATITLASSVLGQ